MLINIESGRDAITTIHGQAHIVISLDTKGETQLQAFSFGAFDCSFFKMEDQRLMQRELPNLLAELRLQIEFGRRLTVEESELVKMQTRYRELSGNPTQTTDQGAV